MAEKGTPLKIIPYRVDDAPTVCIEVNQFWIPFLIAAVYPSRYPEAWLGTLEENRQARQDVLELIRLFMEAFECGMTDNCCPENLTIVIQHQVADDNSSLEMSIDGGQTWTPDNTDPRSQIPVVPAPVGSVANTKCDAAENMIQGLKEAQVAIANAAEGEGNLQEIVLDVVVAILSFLLLPVGGAVVLVPLVIGMVRAFRSMGRAAYDALFTEENWDKTRCALYCNMEDDGSITGVGMAGAKRQIYASVPGDNSPSGAAQNIVDLINFVGIAGLNLIAYTYQTTGADCSTCECAECEHVLDFQNLPYYWLLNAVYGTWEAGADKGWKSTYHTHSDTDYYITEFEYRFPKPCFAGYLHLQWFITDNANTNPRISFNRLLMVDGVLTWENNGFNISAGNAGDHAATVILSTNFILPVYGYRLTLLNVGQPVGHYLSYVAVDSTP